MRKSIAAGTLAIASLAGIGAGVTLSFPGISNASTTTITAETTTDGTATDGTATPAARPDRGAIVTDALAKLVTAGTITQAQADAVSAALQEAMPARGGGGPRGEAGMRGGGHLEVAATALGITADELRTELQAGSSIAQVAEAKGVSIDTVKAALKADLESRLAQAVTDGKITQAQADERLGDADTHVQAEVDQVGLPAGKGGHGGRGGHGPMGRADAPAAAPAAATASA